MWAQLPAAAAHRLGNFCFNARQNRLPPTWTALRLTEKEPPPAIKGALHSASKTSETCPLSRHILARQTRRHDVDHGGAPRADCREAPRHARERCVSPPFSLLVLRRCTTRELTRMWNRQAVARAEEGVPAHVRADELREEGEAEGRDGGHEGQGEGDEG